MTLDDYIYKLAQEIEEEKKKLNNFTVAIANLVVGRNRHKKNIRKMQDQKQSCYILKTKLVDDCFKEKK